jgi:cell division protein FtsN
MKLAFLLLALANLVFFAWQQGVFGGLPDAGREPERVNRQVEPERVRVLTLQEVQALRAKAKEATPPQAASPALPAAGGDASTPGPGPIAAAELAGMRCVEMGDFTVEEAGRVRQRLESLALGERLSLRTVDAPGWFMVYVPPFKTRAEVERRAEELRRAGVKELLVIADNSPMRFGIALGSFRDQDLANRLAADLGRRGIKGVRVADKPSSVQVTRFQLRAVDPALADVLRAIQKEFNAARFQACAA